MTADRVVEIERRSVRAVPAVESATIEGWYVPFGRGEVRRMNAVTTFGIVPSEPLDVIQLVERRYAGRHRPTWFRLTELDRQVDELLFARGYGRSAEVLVMWRPAAGAFDPGVSAQPAVTRRWLEDLARLGEYSELRIAEIGESLAALALTHAAFRIGDDAVGLAVADSEWVGLFDIAVTPDRRRRRLGTRITQSMMAWASERGATRAYLQVMSDNSPGVGLYHAMGFEVSHRYWYRAKH